MCDERRKPQQQGYCGLCRILYRDLNQHLSSLKHLDAVHSMTKVTDSTSSHYSCQSGHILLERFLQDVIKHHPHSYNINSCDAGPSGHPCRLQSDNTSFQQHYVETTPPCTQSPPPVHRKARPPPVSWFTWQRIRRQQQRDEFSSQHSSSTIEEVIRRYCYDQEEDDKSDSVHYSLPVSMETQTDEWDAEVQMDPEPTHVPLAQMESLLEAQVEMDQDYNQELDWALEGPGGLARQGFLEQPIETVLPAPQVIPVYFKGKSWRQIEEEDEARVLKLVQQFRMGVRTCYFDSDSLARYGRRSCKKTIEEPDMLPLLGEDAESEHRKEWCFPLAARCQVVKLSRATQTVCVSSPAIAPPPDALSPETPPAEALPTEAARTPEDPLLNQQLLSGTFPEKYSPALTPVQRQTSVLYLLCSPCVPEPALNLSPRRRRRAARPHGSKVTYRRLPLTPFTVNPLTVKVPLVKPRCVRQLFRSLSPELNTGPATKPSLRQYAATSRPITPRREGLRSRRPQR